MSERPVSTRQQAAIGVLLVTLLVAVYFLTFRGYAISGDEWQLFDATESLARRGTLELNYRADEFLPNTLATARPPSANTEPLQPALAALLFLAAQTLPAIGLAHTVWVFNVLITALTGGVLYAYGLGLGYRTRTAAITALVFGLGTIAWPYSRTFFREPLFTLLALLSAYLMLRLRLRLSARRRPIFTLLAFAAVYTATLLSKEAALLITPAILIEALPPRLSRVRLTRRNLAMLLGATIFAGLLAVLLLNADTLFGISNRYAFVARMGQARRNLSDASEGITGYLFTPARGIWWYSPVLLLGFLGWPLLARQRRWRQIALPAVLLISFVVGYAVVRGPQWYGGLGWGARYMAPLTPFLALWLLPVIDHLLARGAPLWQRAGALAVLALSVGVQLVAILVSALRYYAVLDAHHPPLIAWTDGLWSLRWSPLWVTLQQVGKDRPDLAWTQGTSTQWLLPAACVALAAAAVIWLVVWIKRPDASRQTLLLTLGSLGAAAALALFGGLYAIRHDPRYYGDFAPTRDLLAALEAEARPDDVIVLNNREYAEFFMNYYKRSRPVIYTLPRSPGERYSPEQAPDVLSAAPDALVQPSLTLTLADIAARYERLWLVNNTSRFISWSIRPVEQYLAHHYFPVSEIAPHDLARAVLFDLTHAPPAPAAAWPTQRVDATFGDSVQLVGIDLPAGTQVTVDGILPVSLLWQAVGPVPQDYTVGLYLVSADGQLVAQQDTFPDDWFDPTGTWRSGSLHRDNRGLYVPSQIAPGTYELWAALYWWQTPTERLPVTGPDGVPLGDHCVLTTIVVEP